MTTFTGSSNLSKSFTYKPEDDPLFQDADTKALLSGAAQASLSRLAKPGGVWNQDEFDKITKHYMKPIEQQTKQRSESLQAFFRSRGWSDSGSAPDKNLKLFADAERQAAENVYVPLTLEAMRQRDTTAQADIQQAANLGNQRLSSYLQSRGQQFQEYSTSRQLDQTDDQVAIQLRGMAVQERSQLLNEVNSAYARAAEAGRETGRYVDPQTGQSFETLQAKKDQLARAIDLMKETGFMPESLARESGANSADIARAQGMPEEEITRIFGVTGARGGLRLTDFISPEDAAVLGGTPAADASAGNAGNAPGATPALSPAQQSYVDGEALTYGLTPDERNQIATLLVSGSPTASQDIYAIIQTAYNRRLPASQGEPTPEPTGEQGGGGVPAGPTSPPPLTASAVSLIEQVRGIGGTADDLTELERRLRAGDVSGALNLAQQVDERRSASTGGTPPSGTTGRGLRVTQTPAGGRAASTSPSEPVPEPAGGSASGVGPNGESPAELVSRGWTYNGAAGWVPPQSPIPTAESSAMKSVRSGVAAGQPIPRNLWARLTASERSIAQAIPGFRLAKT